MLGLRQDSIKWETQFRQEIIEEGKDGWME